MINNLKELDMAIEKLNEDMRYLQCVTTLLNRMGVEETEDYQLIGSLRLLGAIFGRVPSHKLGYNRITIEWLKISKIMETWKDCSEVYEYLKKTNNQELADKIYSIDRSLWALT